MKGLRWSSCFGSSSASFVNGFTIWLVRRLRCVSPKAGSSARGNPPLAEGADLCFYKPTGITIEPQIVRIFFWFGSMGRKRFTLTHWHRSVKRYWSDGTIWYCFACWFPTGPCAIVFLRSSGGSANRLRWFYIYVISAIVLRWLRYTGIFRRSEPYLDDNADQVCLHGGGDIRCKRPWWGVSLPLHVKSPLLSFRWRSTVRSFG